MYLTGNLADHGSGMEVTGEPISSVSDDLHEENHASERAVDDTATCTSSELQVRIFRALSSTLFTASREKPKRGTFRHTSFTRTAGEQSLTKGNTRANDTVLVYR